MNKRRSNKRRVKLEARPRGTYPIDRIGRRSDYYDKDGFDITLLSRREKRLISGLICAIIFLSTFLASHMDTDMSRKVVQTMSKAISYQVQWNEVFKSDIIASFEEKVASLIGGNEVAVSGGMTDPLTEPVNGHIANGFEEVTHSVFKTTIEPRGIEYSIFESQNVVASNDGIVSNILDSTYQGKRVVLQHEGGYKTVYDGIENIAVEQGQIVKKGESLGHIEANEQLSKRFFFEVWKDNVAVDPTELFDVEG